MSINFPWPVEWRRDASNGQSPSAHFYRGAVDSINHLTAYGGREVFSRSWQFNTVTGATGTTNLARFRFRSKPGASKLTFVVVMGLAGAGTNPRCEIDVKVSGGSTTTLDAIHYGITSATATDVPSEWFWTDRSATIAGVTVYEVLIKSIDFARVLSVIAYEQTDLTIQESTNYYSGLAPTAGLPIYDSHRERLLPGLANMYRHQAGILWHWAKLDGSARTRTSATKINLIDNATTGSPAVTAPGVYLDCTYRNTASRTTVPFELAVYASCTGSSGYVYLTDTGGTDLATITVTGAASWLTATVSLPNSSSFYGLRFAGDGANTISVFAVSLIEWES